MPLNYVVCIQYIRTNMNTANTSNSDYKIHVNLFLPPEEYSVCTIPCAKVKVKSMSIKF